MTKYDKFITGVTPETIEFTARFIGRLRCQFRERDIYNIKHGIIQSFESDSLRNYVYCLIDPISNKPYYVGYTTNLRKRYQSHIGKARSYLKHRNDDAYNYEIHTAEILENGDFPKMFVLYTDDRPSDGAAISAEIYWYKTLTAAGYDLHNITYITGFTNSAHAIFKSVLTSSESRGKIKELTEK